jgi:hypothetical protein
VTSDEKARKDLQEVFEKIQSDYRKAMEDAFVVQRISLEFARNLLESSAETLGNEAEANSRRGLIALSVESRRQRDALETLLAESARTYANLLRATFRTTPPN